MSNAEEAQDELLAALLDPAESTRINAMGGVLLLLESYLRAMSSSLTGVGVNHQLTEDLARDLLGTRHIADWAARWLQQIQVSLAEHQAKEKPAGEPIEPTAADKVIH